MSSPNSAMALTRLFEQVLAGLRGIGYENDLLQESYRFEDWFAVRVGQAPELRAADAAAFGRFPFSSDSACFAVVLSNGVSGANLVNRYRALGAPLAFEVQQDRVLLWRVQATATTANRPIVLTPAQLEPAFRDHAGEWNPASLLRAKNIGPAGPMQRDFIDIGLIPALEQNILEKLDP